VHNACPGRATPDLYLSQALLDTYLTLAAPVQFSIFFRGVLLVLSPSNA